MALKLFKYTATDKDNIQVAGTYKAETREQVADYLQSRGLFIVSIDEDFVANLKKLGDIQIGGVPLKEKLLISKQLTTMMRAGLPVLQALEILNKQVENKILQDQLIQVQAGVEGGAPLSVAFKKNSTIYNSVQLNLLAAGEKSGNLIEILEKITIDLEKSNSLRSKIRSAMIYPVIIFIAILIVMIILITFMLPTVEGLYDDFNALDQMPDITKFLINVSNFFSDPFGLITIIVISVIAYLSYRSFSATTNGKYVIGKLTLRMPVFGNLIQKMQLAQFGRLLALMLTSGVSIIDALDIVSKAMSNPVYSKAIASAVPEISKGTPLAVPLAKSGVFPIIYIRMIATGEQTGNLDKVLQDMGKFYEDEVNEITDNLTKLMEPLILLLVGGLVGFLAVAVYLPIYNIGNVIT